jgi:hypothetical protein
MNNGTGPCGDASTLHDGSIILISEGDPKDLFDDYQSTASPPTGWYPDGIDMNNHDLFMPVTDNTDATDVTTGPRQPASVLPRTPLGGEMMSRRSS